MTRRARAAASAASRLPSTRGGFAFARWRHRPTRNGRSPISGVSGAICRARGHVAIFDRSWYGRVLVERVEGFASSEEWLRAYGEINAFEEELSRSGIIVVKFWLAIDKDEQLRRFQEREQIEFKRFKITAEDWRNREKWDDYAAAVNDMVDRTSTGHAPWTLVEAKDKRWARVKVLSTLCDRIEAALQA